MFPFSLVNFKVVSLSRKTRTTTTKINLAKPDFDHHDTRFYLIEFPRIFTSYHIDIKNETIIGFARIEFPM